ncbi:MAG: ThiF family adenylyltransferase, partial [Armatimonadota bacterium]
IARRHISSINPHCRVTAIQGSLPQQEVLDAVAAADIALGCTDQHYARVALSDLACRYCVPVIDCGVSLEGKDGAITGQVIELTRMFPADPCVYCRRRVDSRRVQQELMSPTEREQRMAAAEKAAEQGLGGDPYWKNVPQMNTVGYLTTAVGAMAAGYAIGYITDRFRIPFGRLQLDLCAPLFAPVDQPCNPRPDCSCRRARGLADQGMAEALITTPAHW